MRCVGHTSVCRVGHLPESLTDPSRTVRRKEVAMTHTQQDASHTVTLASHYFPIAKLPKAVRKAVLQRAATCVVRGRAGHVRAALDIWI